ncbi:cephalotoxin-like protein [Etheostoma spectabile]|uniref:cephalotoxin-like protein n=1 Tax=Etheostoma spectabile TaxID=54343 RepID=UPI0013AF9C5F|nr:cephalotoxin-like protein [Etheostoma spectabile]
MAFPRLSASMLLASLILLLYWTTSSARSHDPTSTNLSPPYRVKRDLPFEAREKVDRALATLAEAKALLPLIKKGLEKFDSQKLTAVMKSLSNISSLVPGIGGLITALVNMALIFIPQTDPVLNEVKKGFAEVNRKLDSISIQISNLATDVEWYNYASVYSQDEVRILNSWKRFSDLLQNSNLLTNEEDKLRLAEMFVNYYENTGTESSVSNLYHYLTIRDTSLSRNLNDLLTKKFKCDIQEIGKYNVYFSSLLWKGMVLNQVYWKLIGLDSTGIEAEHTKMFKDVYETQKLTVHYCLANYKHYLKQDVVEISKGLSADDTTAIANKVKRFLDSKYFWYNWVVMVYKDEDKNHELYNMIKIPAGTTTVNVGHVQKAEEISKEAVKTNVDGCYARDYGKHYPPRPAVPITTDVTTCKKIQTSISQCRRDTGAGPIGEFVKVMHASSSVDLVQVPEALLTIKCIVDKWYNPYKLFVYYSRTCHDCEKNPCKNGKCIPLWDTNEYLCECPPGYYGDRCETRIDINNIKAIYKGRTVPDITISAKLKKIQLTLDNMRRGH